MEEVGLTSGKDDYEGNGLLYFLNMTTFSTNHEKFKLPNRIRNLGVAIKFRCENGHTFFKVYSFHKGTTFITKVK